MDLSRVGIFGGSWGGYTMKMVEALTRAGKFYDLIVLPGQTHRLTGEHRDYYLDRVRRYFVEHLKP
jgi:dipeptidyl aminopeptidase/acylaminoacyl peptidase